MRRWRAGATRRGARGRLARALGAAFAGALALLLLAGGAAWLRLAQGPVDLGALTPRIEAAANAALGGSRLTLESAALTLGGEGDGGSPFAGVRFTRARIADAQGRVLFAAPSVVARLKPLELLRGRIRLTEVAVIGAGVRLTRDASGRFRLGIGGDAGSADAEADGEAAAAADDPAGEAEAAREGFSQALDALARGAPGPLEALRAFSLSNARLVYRDDSAGRVWRAERADLRVTRADGALRATASVALPGGALGPTYLRAEGARDADGGAQMRLSFSGVATRDLVDEFPALEGLQVIDAPMQGSAAVGIDPDGRLTGFDGVLRAAAGAIRLDGAAVALEGAMLDFALDPAARRFDVRRFALRTAWGDAEGRGVVLERLGPDGGPGEITAQADLGALTLNPPDLLAGPVAFDAGAATLRVRLDPLRLEVSDAWLAQGPLRIDARATAALGPEGWTAEIAASAEAVEAAALVALWPLAAAPGARDWIAQNVEAGTVRRADAFARLGPQGERFAVTFAVEDVTAHAFRPLPPVTGASGWGEVTERAFAMTLDAGAVAAPGGGALALGGSTMRLPDLDDPLSTAVIDLAGTGPLDAMLTVLDFPPLGFPSKVDIDPRSVTGDAEVAARLTLPLLKDLLIEQVEVAVSATVRDLAMTAPGIDMEMRSERVTLNASVDQLSASGLATLDGAPLRLDWTETFSPAPGAPQSRFNVAGGLDAARMARLGLDPRPWLDGEMGVQATVELLPDGAMRFDAALDLAGAALSAAPLAWRKAAGAPARATLAGALNGDLALNALSLEAPGLSAQGSARLDAGGTLQALRLTRVGMGAQADLAVDLTREAGALNAALSGALLDVRLFDGAEGDDGGSGPPVAVTLALDTLRLSDRVAIRSARGEASRRPDGALDARLRGRLGGALELRYEERAGVGRAALTNDDAGALLRALGVEENGVGGALSADVEVRRGEDLSLSGEARIENIVIADDPALRRLLERAEIRGAEAGVQFATVRAPFVFAGDTLTLNGAVAYGPTIGLNVSGDIDIARDRLDLRGVFSPAFALNSALGRIPIIGGLLTGGEGRGLVAFNFRVTGPTGDPQVSVNPLSALTPGVLRRLFEGDGAAPDVEPDRFEDQR